MGLFDKLFNFNNDAETKQTINVEETSQKSINVTKEIEEITKVLESLGLLDINKIKHQLDQEKDFDYSILKRIMIKIDMANIECLMTYFENIKLGYGAIKLNQFKDKMNELANECINEGKNYEEVIEEIIQFARIQIEDYERILKSFNETIKKLEENKTNEAEHLAMIDYWTTYYKEQELGYPIDLNNKVNTMALELRQLPYGGYGEREIKNFIDAANKMIEEAKNNKEESNHTLNRIKSSLYDIKKSRYTADVETLKRKLQMISDSPYLSDFEKDQNKQQTIAEFNQMNGHELDVQSSIEQMKKNLTLLEYGGFGTIVIDGFKDKATDIMMTGRKNGANDETILTQIKEEYNKLIVEYQTRLSKLKAKITKLHEEKLSDIEMQRREEELIEDFNDEMGHPINYQERVDKMYNNLQSIDDMGYGEIALKDFKEQAEKMIENITNPAEGAKAVRDIRKIYYKLIDEYNVLKETYQRKKEEIEHDKRIAVEDRKAKIEEVERKFEMEVGREIDFKTLVSNHAESLTSLGKVGYGEKTINEYKEDCNKIIESDLTQQEKYHQINQKYENLKERYMVNQNTFNEWKFLQLKNVKGTEKETLSKNLDDKIAYMLSLSPDDLNEYFLEDDRQKREEREKHNYKIAYKFLARQESKRKADESIYTSRMEEFNQGKKTYSDKEIDEATTRIERIELTADDIPKEDRLISVVDYIDSTLLRQILYVEAATSKKKYLNKI